MNDNIDPRYPRPPRAPNPNFPYMADDEGVSMDKKPKVSIFSKEFFATIFTMIFGSFGVILFFSLALISMLGGLALSFLALQMYFEISIFWSVILIGVLSLFTGRSAIPHVIHSVLEFIAIYCIFNIPWYLALVIVFPPITFITIPILFTYLLLR